MLTPPTLITPEESNRNGIFWSIIVGVIVLAVVWAVLTYTLDFWYLDELLAPIVAVAAGALAGYAMYTDGRRMKVRVNGQGYGTFFGRPIGPSFDAGDHWRPPFSGMLVVPGPRELIAMDLPGAEINAQDGSKVFLGIHRNPSANKPNRMEYWVVIAPRYIRVRYPKEQLRTEFLALGRLFFGEMKQAVAAKTDVTLICDYLELPPKTEDGWEAKHGAFEKRLTEAKYAPGGGKTEDTIFTPKAVEKIMLKAGEFKEFAETWGIQIRQVYIQNVRLNPVIEDAADEFAATTAKMDTAQLQLGTITRLTKELADTGVTPNLATLVVTSQIDPEAGVNLEHKTIDFPQADKAVEILAAKAIELVAKIKESK